MFAVKGIIRGDSVLADAAAVREYQGRTAVVTVIDDTVGTKKDAGTNLSVFVKPTERGKNTDVYLEALRNGDRI